MKAKGSLERASYTSRSAQGTVHCTGYKYLGSNCVIVFMIAQSLYCWKHRTKVCAVINAVADKSQQI